MPSRTNQRLSESIRHRAAHVILHELKDPRMGFVTITRVELASDLISCTIFWSVLGNAGQRSKTTHALDHAKLFIQRRVAEGLHIRHAPQLAFEYDESVEGAIKMGTLLKQLRVDRGEPPEAPAEPDAAGSTSASGEPPADAADDADEADEADDAEDTDDADADADDAEDAEDGDDAGEESDEDEEKEEDDDQEEPDEDERRS